MPVLERDPWRYQFFDKVPCPDHVMIPTDDPDCWELHPGHRWVYDKLRVAESQGLVCGPHGVPPPSFPVFSKPLMNLKGMGIGSRAIFSARELELAHQAGHFWLPLLEGRHISTDCAIAGGAPAWFRHAEGKVFRQGMFDYWTIHGAPMTELEAYIANWIENSLAGFTGLVNFETIGGAIIEVHLRFADQWCDLYGAGWVEALVALYEHGRWRFRDEGRKDAYSLALFARHGEAHVHPSPEHQAAIRAMPGIASLQITFHEGKDPAAHPMPPGGFRLGIVNAWDLDKGQAARRKLAEAFPANSILWP